MSEDFPASWRYVPLKLLRLEDGHTKYICSIPYEKNPVLKALGTFAGVDVNGVVHFVGENGEDNTIADVPYLKNGIAGLAEQPGMAVGIFPEFCRPRLVIVDCDSVVEVITTGSTARFATRRGRDQLLKLAERHGGLPPCPAVKGNREGHGYLVFRQNRNYPIRNRKIKPLGLAFDVLPRGYQIHWTVGNRALMAGQEMLDNPPELPAWLAQVVLRHKKDTKTDVPTGQHVDIDGTDAWNTMFREAVLRDVTPQGSAWNQRLFNAACTLAENGVPWDRLVDLIIERCEPETPADAHSAMTSIASAWRKVTGEAVPE